MARRRRKAKRGVSPHRTPARWPVFLTGCAAGTAAAFFLSSAELPRLPSIGGLVSDPAGRSGEGAAATPSSKLTYDFYTALPEQEVALLLEDEGDPAAIPAGVAPPPAPLDDAPQEEPAAAARESGAAEEAAPLDVAAVSAVEAVEVSAPSPPPETREPVVGAVKARGTYLLQVGSFRDAGQAEKRRATLALLGLEARVQTISIDGAVTWHRVQVGPYDELGALNNVRVRLRENDIETMVLKIRSP